MKNKATGFYFAVIAAVLTVATLVMTLLYANSGGIVSPLALAALVAALVCEVSLFFGERAWTDFTGIAAAVLLAFAMMRVLSDGIWNIAEAINGIKMVGLPELAGTNVSMAVVSFLAILACIVSCFAKKSKTN
ncbi:hypothetical protein [uncultured Gemmiger sp.]|uniref:hypothetical protein n=1 Tax=uncultured Gemmiger sp. TaxID=1623490 RepID=UPI0025D82FCA|nr:hypothetical protein [uncultured Gemmiger sp.]